MRSRLDIGYLLRVKIYLNIDIDRFCEAVKQPLVREGQLQGVVAGWKSMGSCPTGNASAFMIGFPTMYVRLANRLGAQHPLWVAEVLVEKVFVASRGSIT